MTMKGPARTSLHSVASPTGRKATWQSFGRFSARSNAKASARRNSPWPRAKSSRAVVRGSERPMGRMQSLGMGWTYLHTYRSVDQELANFEAVNLKDIRKVLDRYPFEALTILALGPLAKMSVS